MNRRPTLLLLLAPLGLASCISLPAELEPTQAEVLFAGDPALVSSAKTCIKGLNRHVEQARESHFLRTVTTSVSGGLAGTGGLIGALDDSAVGTIGSVVAMLGGVSSLVTSNLLDPSNELGAHARALQSYLAARRFWVEGDKARAEEALQNCWQDKETLAPEEKTAPEAQEDRRATRVACNGVFMIVDDEGLVADTIAREPITVTVEVDPGKTATLVRFARCVGDEVQASLELTATWAAAGKADMKGLMRYAEGDSCGAATERGSTVIERTLSAFVMPVTQLLEDDNGSFQIAMTCNAMPVAAP